jgi:selenide, water dikinase
VSEVTLTKYSHGSGCACKLGPAELSEVLGPVKGHPATVHPDLLVGLATSDDAGVYSLGDGRALVQTIDIFTPVVDSPGDWGRIAAANALSDIYAMGATPLTALQYLAWPRGLLSFETATEVVSAGLGMMESAGCTVVGGHSIDSPEPTYGFAVTGIADAGRVLTNAGGRPGDLLVLTKPLGIGIITTAIKRGECPPEVERAAIDTMTTLNAAAASHLHDHAASAATDVTGFGLLGHLLEMCTASGVGAEIERSAVPILDGAVELLAAGMWAGGSQRNLEATLPAVISDLGLDELKPLFDAQTSGGLLAALPSNSAGRYTAAVPGAVVIGRLVPGGQMRVV